MDQVCFSTLEILQWTEEPGPSSEDFSVLVREMHSPQNESLHMSGSDQGSGEKSVGSRDTKTGQGLCYTGLPKVSFQQRGDENTSHAGAEGRARRRREQ